jgi:hypothetical protein
MTIRFAAAQSGNASIVARILGGSMPLRAANDNTWNLSGDRVVQAALRHFARHGLAAAQVAMDRAEDAFFAGDRDGFRMWSAICRVLDRRMAAARVVRHER